MLRDVNISITDGGLGSATETGEGVHIKIGASPVVSSEYITIRGSMDHKKIKELLGNCPLADAVMDSIFTGSNLIYCYPVTPSVAGTISEVTAVKSGTGILTAAGEPTNEFKIIVEIQNSGELNVATFIYSLNAGETYSDEITVPLAGEYEIDNSGIRLTFAVPTGQGFVSGDKFSLTTTAPALSNQNVLDTLEKIKNIKKDYEFIHVVGPGNKALWAALSIEADRFFNTYKYPIFFVSEARNIKEDDASLDSYVQSLLAERQGIANKYVQVVSARAMYNKMDGTIKDVNCAGIVCGLYARARVSQSIGETREFPVQGITKLLPEVIEDYHIESLDEAKYLTFRQYIGLDGYYVTNAKMMCPDGSDYIYAERIRVSNKLAKQVRAKALLELQKEVDMSDVDKSLAVTAEFIQEPIDRAVENKEISSGRIIIPEGQDILGTEKLNLIIRYVPKGHYREIDVDLGIEKPNS